MRKKPSGIVSLGKSLKILEKVLQGKCTKQIMFEEGLSETAVRKARDRFPLFLWGFKKSQ